jgi:hypothetical protein
MRSRALLQDCPQANAVQVRLLRIVLLHREGLDKPRQRPQQVALFERPEPIAGIQTRQTSLGLLIGFLLFPGVVPGGLPADSFASPAMFSARRIAPSPHACPLRRRTRFRSSSKKHAVKGHAGGTHLHNPLHDRLLILVHDQAALALGTRVLPPNRGPAARAA